MQPSVLHFEKTDGQPGSTPQEELAVRQKVLSAMVDSYTKHASDTEDLRNATKNTTVYDTLKSQLKTDQEVGAVSSDSGTDMLVLDYAGTKAMLDTRKAISMTLEKEEGDPKALSNVFAHASLADQVPASKDSVKVAEQ